MRPWQNKAGGFPSFPAGGEAATRSNNLRTKINSLNKQSHRVQRSKPNVGRHPTLASSFPSCVVWTRPRRERCFWGVFPLCSDTGGCFHLRERLCGEVRVVREAWMVAHSSSPESVSHSFPKLWSLFDSPLAAPLVSTLARVQQSVALDQLAFGGTSARHPDVGSCVILTRRVHL